MAAHRASDRWSDDRSMSRHTRRALGGQIVCTTSHRRRRRTAGSGHPGTSRDETLSTIYQGKLFQTTRVNKSGDLSI
jgi:hypothetical protein